MNYSIIEITNVDEVFDFNVLHSSLDTSGLVTLIQTCKEQCLENSKVITIKNEIVTRLQNEPEFKSTFLKLYYHA